MNERGGSDDNVDCVDCLFLLESSGKAAAFCSFSSAGNTMRGICFEECCEYEEEEEEEEMGGKRTRAKEATGAAGAEGAEVEEAALQ